MLVERSTTGEHDARMKHLPVASFLVSMFVAGCAVEQETVESEVAASSHCPSGNGFYVLYYGTVPDDFKRIHDAAPNFVVLGDGLEGRMDLPMLFHGPPYVRVFAYLATGK